MTYDRMVKKLRVWKPLSTRLAGRPKIIWENDIKGDLRIMIINNWIKCTQEWVIWKEVVEKAKPLNSEEVEPDEEGEFGHPIVET